MTFTDHVYHNVVLNFKMSTMCLEIYPWNIKGIYARINSGKMDKIIDILFFTKICVALTVVPWWYFLYFTGGNKAHKEKLCYSIKSDRREPWAPHSKVRHLQGETSLPSLCSQSSMGTSVLCSYLINRKGRKDSGFALRESDLAPPRVQFYSGGGTFKATAAVYYDY